MEWKIFGNSFRQEKKINHCFLKWDRWSMISMILMDCILCWIVAYPVVCVYDVGKADESGYSGNRHIR